MRGMSGGGKPVACRRKTVQAADGGRAHGIGKGVQAVKPRATRVVGIRASAPNRRGVPGAGSGGTVGKLPSMVGATAGSGAGATGAEYKRGRKVKGNPNHVVFRRLDGDGGGTRGVIGVKPLSVVGVCRWCGGKGKAEPLISQSGQILYCEHKGCKRVTIWLEKTMASARKPVARRVG